MQKVGAANRPYDAAKRRLCRETTVTVVMCHGLEGYLAKLQSRILENVDGIRNLTITGKMDSPKFGNGCELRKKMIFEIVMKHVREAGFL